MLCLRALGYRKEIHRPLLDKRSGNETRFAQLDCVL